MTELIKVQTSQKGNPIVDARDLHKFLQVPTDFTDWCKRMFNYGFKKDVDFTLLSRKSTGGRPSVTYVLTLDCAKSISMLQRTEIGRQARDYFIECEKQLRSIKKEISNPPNYPAALRAWADEIEKRAMLEQKVKTLEPLALMAETVLANDKEINMREVAGVINIKGLGRNKLFKLLRDKKVLSDGNLPYRIYIDRGYFRVIETIVGEKLIISTHVTQKGLQYVLKLIEKETPV